MSLGKLDTQAWNSKVVSGPQIQMWGTSAYKLLTQLIFKILWRGDFYSVLQVSKLRIRKIKWLILNYKASKCQIFNPKLYHSITAQREGFPLSPILSSTHMLHLFVPSLSVQMNTFYYKGNKIAWMSQGKRSSMSHIRGLKVFISN